MICLRENEQGADLLIGYLEGTLPEAERAELDRHAAACAECRGMLEVQQDLDEFPAPEVSPDFDARLYARIAGGEQKAWWRRLLWRPIVPLAAAAAWAVVLIVQTQAPAVPAVEKAANDAQIPQIEMVEQALEDMELLMPLEAL